MLHNGIEHAHLSIISETRALLHHQLGMSNDDIADLFESWYKEGPLRGNFLIGIGYKGLRFKRGDGITDERGIVEEIEDKVTQDVDLSEGTGTWSTRVSHYSVSLMTGNRGPTCRCSRYRRLAPAQGHLRRQGRAIRRCQEPSDTPTFQIRCQVRQGLPQDGGEGGVRVHSRCLRSRTRCEYTRGIAERSSPERQRIRNGMSAWRLVCASGGRDVSSSLVRVDPLVTDDRCHLRIPVASFRALWPV